MSSNLKFVSVRDPNSKPRWPRKTYLAFIVNADRFRLAVYCGVDAAGKVQNEFLHLTLIESEVFLSNSSRLHSVLLAAAVLIFILSEAL